MRVSNRKQVIEKYGFEVYNELQKWVHSDGRPAHLLLDEEVKVPAVLFIRENTFELLRDCYGYVFAIDTKYPEDMIPAFFMYHHFGDRNNYLPDVR